MCPFVPYGLGWHPDVPDPRDYTPSQADVAGMLGSLKARAALPQCVDWREYFLPVADQQDAGTSVAQACVGLLRYFERRATGRMIEPSAMFVHQTARRLLGRTGSGGEELRSTWKAVVRYGVPAERLWPYEPARLEEQPDAFVYASAEKVPGLCYLRLDCRNDRGDAVLRAIKSFLAAGFPSGFGFSLCASFSSEAEIPFPTVFDSVRGGQAAVAVGYDDSRKVRSHRGALLIANSLGAAWGDHGMGWLPYAYVRQYLAADFWTLVAPLWLASGEFHRPA
jgi:C1A family cysteine protease